ncbi:putative transcription factor & chromatin remodeling ARID family [Helianthus annuus]|nr:putative transcription factor & chromatin remodeling ARID family [Helianthus annuus]
MKTGNDTLRIHSVFYSPELDQNVLSLDQLMLQGFTVRKSGDTFKIFPMFSSPVVNTINEVSGLTKEEEMGLSEKQRLMDLCSVDDEFKDNYLNSYFETLNVSNDDENDWSRMIIRALEFHDFADCKALLDMIDGRDFVFKYKYDLEKKFEEMVKWFLNVYMGITSRPVPPYTPNKRRIDLLSLYVLVARDGGYRDVTSENLWPVVAKDLGFDYQDGDYMRIIYAMYLDILEYYYRFKSVQEKVYDKEMVNEEECPSQGCHERRKSTGDIHDDADSAQYALFAGNGWEDDWNFRKKRKFNHMRKAVEDANRSVMQHTSKHN